MCLDRGERLSWVKIADDRGRGVVRPVEGVVESAELFNRHELDVTAPANGIVMIRMRLERGGPNFLAQRAHGFILAALEFIAHHRHLRAAVFFAKRQVSHALSLDFDEQRQRVSRHGGVVIGAVEPCGRVRLRADAFKNLIVTGAEAAVMFGAALEHQMLQQMRRAGGAGDFVAGADMIRHHEGGHRRRLHREQQHLQSVGIQFVFRDAANGADISEAIDLGGGVIADGEGR